MGDPSDLSFDAWDGSNPWSDKHEPSESLHNQPAGEYPIAEKGNPSVVKKVFRGIHPLRIGASISEEITSRSFAVAGRAG